MKVLDRSFYLDKIKPYINKQLIKVIVGQRRVGKSVLLRQIIRLIQSEMPEANIIFIDKDDLMFENVRTFKDLADYIFLNSKNTKNYVFIDEVQEIKEFEKTLRSLVKSEKYDIYITGSNAKLLSSELATLLTGRHILFTVHPFSFLEYISINGLEANQLSLAEYLKFGGMPYLANLPKEELIIKEYLDNLINSILFRDIINRYKIRDTAFIRDLITFLASVTGHIVSVTKLQNYLTSKGIKKSLTTISEYLQFLENSFLINMVQRFDLVGKKVFDLKYKYFFEDIGIRNTVIGYKTEDIEKIIENAVFNHLVFLNLKVFVGVLKDKEIDFIAVNHKGEKFYIQVAFKIDLERTFKREVENLLAVKDNFPKIIITTDEFLPGLSETGIRHIPLLKFLQFSTYEELLV